MKPITWCAWNHTRATIQQCHAAQHYWFSVLVSWRFLNVCSWHMMCIFLLLFKHQNMNTIITLFCCIPPASTAPKSCAHLSLKIRGIENATQGRRCKQCIEILVWLIVVASKSAGRAFEWLIFASKHTQFWSFFGRNSGIKSCVGYGKWGQIVPTMDRSVGIGHMQMNLGSTLGRIKQGVAESLRIARNRRRAKRWNFRSMHVSRPQWWGPCGWT